MNLKKLKELINIINKKHALNTVITKKHFRDYKYDSKTYKKLLLTDNSYKIFDILLKAEIDENVIFISDTLLLLGLMFIKNMNLIEYIICKEKSVNYGMEIVNITDVRTSPLLLLTRYYKEWNIPTKLYIKYFDLLVRYGGARHLIIDTELFLPSRYQGYSDLISLLVHKNHYDEVFKLLNNNIVNIDGPQNIGCIDIMEINKKFNCNFIQNISKYVDNIHYIMKYKSTFKFLLTQKNFGDIVHYLFLMNFKVKSVNLLTLFKKTICYGNPLHNNTNEDMNNMVYIIYKNFVIMANYVIKNLNNIDIEMNDLIQIIYISDLQLENYLESISKKIKNLYYKMDNMLLYYIYMYDAVDYEVLSKKLKNNKSTNYNGLYLDKNKNFITTNEYGCTINKLDKNYDSYKKISNIVLKNAIYGRMNNDSNISSNNATIINNKPVYVYTYENYQFNNYYNLKHMDISCIVNIHSKKNLKKLDKYRLLQKGISSNLTNILTYCTPKQIDLFMDYFDFRDLDLEEFRSVFKYFIGHRLNNKKLEYLIEFYKKHFKSVLTSTRYNFNKTIIGNDKDHPLKNFNDLLFSHKNRIDYYDNKHKRNNVEYVNIHDLLCSLYKLGFKFNMNSDRDVFLELIELIPDYRIIELFLKNIGIVAFGINKFNGCLNRIFNNENLAKLKNHNGVDENFDEKLDIIKLLYQHPKLSLKKEFATKSFSTALPVINSLNGDETSDIVQYIIIHTFNHCGIVNFDTYRFKNINMEHIFKLYNHNQFMVQDLNLSMTYYNNEIVPRKKFFKNIAKLYEITAEDDNMLKYKLSTLDVYPEVLTLKDTLIMFIKNKIYNKKVYYGKIPLTLKGTPYKKYKEHVAIPDGFPYILMMRSNR